MFFFPPNSNSTQPSRYVYSDPRLQLKIIKTASYRSKHSNTEKEKNNNNKKN